MVSREQVQGDYLQSPEVSSSTDETPPPPPPPSYLVHVPVGRVTYRQPPPPPHPAVYHARYHRDCRLRTLRYSPEEPFVCRYLHHMQKHDTASSTRSSIIALGGIFLSTLVILWWIYNGFPELQEEERVHMKIPWNLDDAKNLGTVLYRYKGDHFYHVYFGVSIMYIFLQTFAIPGSLFLSVLSGFLFSFTQAMLLVSACSAIGASLCFLISHLLGRRIIYKYFPERAAAWAATVARHRANLLNYVIFLRVTPFLPNWFINLTAPVIGVPLRPFALGTLIGVMPPSFVALQAGQTLHSMSAEDARVSWTSMALLIAFGCVALLPIYFKDRLRKKFE